MNPGDIISYLDLCRLEGDNLQRWMNFRERNRLSIYLMTIWTGSPYADRVEENGHVVIYEAPRSLDLAPAPGSRKLKQPIADLLGRKTHKGLFYDAAIKATIEKTEPELLKIYEKIKDKVWVYNGLFKLSNAWLERRGSTQIFSYDFELIETTVAKVDYGSTRHLDTSRVIPSNLKQTVWKRDNGQCVKCGARDKLHYDHDLPLPKGGESAMAATVQLLCARHALNKRDQAQ